jgi:hypothetical protein
LTPSLLAETTRSMLNPKYVKLVMTVDFTRRTRQYSLPARDIRRRTKRALDMAKLPAWPASFSSVKITLGITFEVRHHRRLAPDGSDDKDEALPGCFKTSIGLVEERIGKKAPLERPPGWRQIHGLRYSWTAEATSALDFSGKKSAQEGVATEPPSLTWCRLMQRNLDNAVSTLEPSSSYYSYYLIASGTAVASLYTSYPSYHRRFCFTLKAYCVPSLSC